MNWRAWAVARSPNNETFYASRHAIDPNKSGDDAYSFQRDRRRYKSRQAAQARADELNSESPATVPS